MERSNLQRSVGDGWPASLHLICKDILRFHTAYWPAMLMSAGINLPKMVFGHGFLTKVGSAKSHYETLSLSSACQFLKSLYMDERAPWSLFKKGDAGAESAAKDLVVILEAMMIITACIISGHSEFMSENRHSLVFRRNILKQ